MRFLGNIIWLVFGGIFIAIEYVISSFLLMITIIGIPFGLQTLKLALLALWPFGTTHVTTENATGCLATIMNIIWFSDRIGIRLQGRLLMPLYFAGAGVYFGSGGSGLSVGAGSTILQGDLTAGLIIGLGDL